MLTTQSTGSGKTFPERIYLLFSGNFLGLVGFIYAFNYLLHMGFYNFTSVLVSSFLRWVIGATINGYTPAKQTNFDSVGSDLYPIAYHLFHPLLIVFGVGRLLFFYLLTYLC